MTRLTLKDSTGATPVPKTLAQQHADFTSEGSPPPGQVAGVQPPSTDAKRVSRSTTRRTRAVKQI